MANDLQAARHRAAGKPTTPFDDFGSLAKKTTSIALTSGAALVAMAPVASADAIAGTVTTGKGSSDLNTLRNTLANDQQVATFKTSSKSSWGIDEVEFEVKELPEPEPEPEPELELRATTNETSRSDSREPVAEDVTPNPVGGSIADIAANNLGIPYSNQWDCSGFVQYVYAQAGKSIPRSSQGMRNAGTVVSDPQPGDVVWWPGHVGIYMGNGMMIDSSDWGTVTEYRKLWSSKTPTFLRF